MENDAIPIGANIKPVLRSRWKKELVQLTGKSEPGYIHHVSPLLMQSYAEIGEIHHMHNIGESPCSTHYNQSSSADMLDLLYSGSQPGIVLTANPAEYSVQNSLSSLGVSALEFNTEGTYLAEVTRSACLTVHKFESLYSHSNESGEAKEEKKQLQHFPLSNPGYLNSINAVRWNPSNQEEIAYTSLRNGELTIFDIQYSQAIQALSMRPPSSQGLSDIAFLNDGTRVLASDTRGAISMWDRRVSNLPQRVLTTNKKIGLTSIQLLGDQCVYGASSGFIHIWDLRGVRGGRSSAAFLSDKEVHSSPLISVNLESMVNEGKRNIQQMGIQSININPSCPYQLGFHLDDGWSGVLDMHNYRVSHIYCPPLPYWLSPNDGFFAYPPRKPSWLPEHSIYAAASAYSNGLYLIDFYPHPSSPCHVDYDDSKNPRESGKHKQSIFVPLSKRVTACAVHPLNGTIVAGTLNASVLTISQKHLSKKGDGDDDDEQHS